MSPLFYTIFVVAGTLLFAFLAMKLTNRSLVKHGEIIADENTIKLLQEKVDKAHTALKGREKMIRHLSEKVEMFETANNNLVEEIKFHKSIGENAASFVGQHFQNIMNPSVIQKLKTYKKEDIVSNFQKRIESCMEGLKNVDFTRL